MSSLSYTDWNLQDKLGMLVYRLLRSKKKPAGHRSLSRQGIINKQYFTLYHFTDLAYQYRITKKNLY